MKLKLILLCCFSIFLFSLNVVPARAYTPLGDACTGNGAKSPACQQQTKQSGSSTNPVVETIRKVANLIALVGGIGAVIIIIIGGLNYATAGGGVSGQRANDPNKAKSARASIIGAAIGLVIIALAWSIVTFVTSKLIKF